MAAMKVRVEDSVFAVERALLTQHCDYFRALFRSGMKECEQEELHLKGLTARGFLIVLGVLRGERPMLDGNEIVDAVECASFLQARPVMEHLVNMISSDNCVLMYHTAATYGLRELAHSAALFLRDICTDLRDEVRCLPEELTDYMESLVPSAYVTVGAHSPTIELLQDFVRTVCYLDEAEEAWKVLTDLPTEASTTMAGLAVLDNKLYVVGGVRDMSNSVVDSCFCYDACNDVWSKFSGLQQPRYNLTLVGHDGHLYAIGGERNRVITTAVEVFTVSAGTWAPAAHFPRPIASAPCARTMSRIFICSWKHMGATEIYEYIPGKDKWSLLTTLVRHQSYGHCMVAHRDNLYVMRNGPSDDFLTCVMDCFNLTTGQWTAVPGHYGNSKGALFTAVVRGDSVLTLNRNITLEYSVESNGWKTKREMKGFPRIGSFYTFLLRLPRTGQRLMRKGGLNNYQKFKNQSTDYWSPSSPCAD